MKHQEFVTHKCSFCGIDNVKAKHMVAGPGVSICSECVLVCVETIFRADKEASTKSKGGADE